MAGATWRTSRTCGSARDVATDLGDARYDKMAAAFGGHGENVATVEDPRPALDRALDSGKASSINVQTDPSVLCDLLRSLGSMGIN